jgi:hypothetical protein
MEEKTKAYAKIVGSKGSDTGPMWYAICSHPEDFDSLSRFKWTGPYRDKTDAENAAYDEAKRDNLELEWLY